jgi:hypothetical protein
MTIFELEAIANDILTSEKVRHLYRLSDLRSRNMTYHNYKHKTRVQRRAIAIAHEIEQHYPGTFKPEHLKFAIPLAGGGHDLGKGYMTILDGKEVDRSGYVAAKMLREMMEERGVPKHLQLLVMFAVCNHSAGPSRKALEIRPGRTAWHHERQLVLGTTVLADKADGVRARVRSGARVTIEKLKSQGDAIKFFDELADDNWRNWLASYAIRRGKDIIDPNDNGGNPRYKGSIIRIWDIDTEVCTLDRIMRIGWYSKGNHGCENAARVYGLNYGIEVDGVRHFYNKSRMRWERRA